ncbi:MAG: DsbA family protein [Lactobacillaceae bacterium]|jgi:protein-disulfide isomerase|nr:DsbA family protein [Lactobacillaceae bacterium]
MTFENTIKTISSICASVVIFVLALGIYLSSKGFIMDPEGNIVFVNEAVAQDTTQEDKNIASDLNNVNISVDYLNILGDENAPVTMYEYSSFGCSHCADFHLSTLPKLKKEFIDTGKLKLIFVDFPIDKKSMQGAMLSHCIPEDSYFEFLDIIFKNQREWSFSMRTEKIFSTYASVFGVNGRDAEKCMKDDDIQNRILGNRQQAIEVFKVQGTPSFVLANKNGKEVIHGAVSFDDFKNAINKMLEQ